MSLLSRYSHHCRMVLSGCGLNGRRGPLSSAQPAACEPCVCCQPIGGSRKTCGACICSYIIYYAPVPVYSLVLKQACSCSPNFTIASALLHPCGLWWEASPLHRSRV